MGNKKRSKSGNGIVTRQKQIQQELLVKRIREDLNTLHNQCVVLMSGAGYIVSPLRDPAITGAIPSEEQVELQSIMQLLSKDISRCKADLDTMQAAWTSMLDTFNGDPSSLLSFAPIGNDYQSWIESYNAVVLPNLNRLTIITGNASVAMNRADEVLSAVAPVVIEDAEIIEG